MTTTPLATTRKPEDVPFHPLAVDFAKNHISIYSKSLFRLAQVLAFQNKDEMVITKHISNAIEMIRSTPKRRRITEGIIFLSSVILGISGQGFVAEILKFTSDPATANVSLMLIYATTSFVMAIVAAVTIARS